MASPASSATRPSEAGSADKHKASAASSARPSCEVIAVTTSDEFLLELGEALGGQAAVRPVESIASAIEHLGNSRRAQLIAFDMRGVTDARADIDRAHAHAPQVAILVFADASAEQAAAVNLEGAEVSALLPIPVDRRKTAAALEGALAAAEKRAAAATAIPRPAAPSGAASTQAAPAPVEETPRMAASRGGSASTLARRLPPIALAAGGTSLLVALAAGAWLFFSAPDEMPAASRTAAPPPAASRTAAPPPAATPARARASAPAPAAVSRAEGTLDELLEKARFAMRQRRFTEPAGDNALVYFRSALALDASNAEARDGVARIARVLISRVDDALDAGKPDAAAVALNAARAAVPEDPRLGPFEARLLQSQVTQALTAGDFDRATAHIRAAQKSGLVPADALARLRTDVTRRQDEARIKRATELAAERLREGKLVEPANDSAKHYVQQLRTLAPSAGATQRLGRDLSGAYLRKARESALAGRTNESERWLTEARGAGVAPAEIAAFQKDLAAARQRTAAAEADRLAQLARERVKDGQLLEPANDSGAHYLAALQAADDSHSAIASLRRELAAKLIDRASDAAREGATARVEADLAAARKWGADVKDVQAVQQLASTARAQANARRSVALQKQLKRTRYSPPEYPVKALEKNASGVVTIEYVVDSKGEPRDLRVTEAAPAGLFDKAALNAVRRWRYEPVVIDGVPVEIPTRTVIRFEAPAK